MPGSSNQSTTTNQNYNSHTDPWAPQAGALSGAFSAAQDAYNRSAGVSAPTNFIASFNPAQLAAYQQMVNFGLGGAGQQAGAAGALTSTGVGGIQGALSGYQSFDPTQANNASSILDNANKYVAGQDIDGQVRNAMLNATQTARDVTMPGIEQNAAASGNTNSSRTGIAQGLVQRGLAQQSADLGATLRNSAFQNGLSLAEQQAESNNTNRLAALSGQGALSSSALNGASSSVNNLLSLLSTAGAGGAGLTAGSQAQLNNALQQYQMGVSSPFAPLNQLMQIIGSNNWGSSTSGSQSGTSNTQSSPSIYQIIGGLMGAGGSLFGANGLNIFGGGGGGNH